MTSRSADGPGDTPLGSGDMPLRPGAPADGAMTPPRGDSFPRARGPVAELVARMDWSDTGLGPVAGWPQSLRTALETCLASRFSMWMAWGPELTVLYNDTYHRDTLLNKHPWALGRPAWEVWAEIWPDIGPRIRSVLDTGQATWDERLQLYLERSGYPEETYHTFSYSPLRDDDGRVAGMLCVVAEETNRVLGERRLRTLRELGDISALTAPTAEAAAAAALAVLARTRTDVPFASIYLLDAGATVGRRVAFYGTADEPSIVPVEVNRDRDADRPLWRVLTEGSQRIEDMAARYGGLFDPIDGPSEHVDPDLAVALPLAAAGGGPAVGVLFAGISPFRALDEDYQQFLDLVAGQVSTAIADAAAFQAQHQRAEQLAELDRAKTEFFTGVSHELRTPLTLITGPAEDALTDTAAPLPGSQRTRMELIARNSRRLRRLVDTLLEFSRLEGGALTPDRTPVDLAALTRGIAESFGPAVERAGLRFTIDCPPLDRSVAVDVDMWEKIVLNLLSNAVKYTLEGEITIDLRLLRQAPAREDPAGEDPVGVRLRVRDTGIGIAADELPRLFERFHRVHGAAGRSHEGSGIGLALVSELTALHEGGVEAASVAGEGSTFTVSLPAGALTAGEVSGVSAMSGSSGLAALYRDEALQWAHRPEPGPGSTPPGSALDRPTPESAGPGAAEMVEVGDTAGARVLIAEDNADLRGFLAGLLSPHYQVSVAVNGRDALLRARRDRPDLIVTDVMMPELDGFGLLTELRAHPSTRAVPVIVLSARAGQEASAEALAAGADDYLVKPFASQDLLARVRANLVMARLRGREGAWRTALLHALNDGLVVLDSSGAVIEMNDAFAAMVGYGHDGLPYPYDHPWLPPAAGEPEEYARVTTFWEGLSGQGAGRLLLRLRHRDGHHVWADCTAGTVTDRESGQTLTVVVCRDITDARRAQQRDRFLADVGRILTDPSPLDQRLERCVRAAADVLEDLVVITRAAPDGRMVPVAGAHPTRDDLATAALRLAPYRIPESLVERYQAGRAFVLDPPPDELIREATGGDSDYAARAAFTVHTVLVAPLIVVGRLHGLFTVQSTAARRDHDPDDVVMLEELARRVAAALETDRVATAERQLHDATTALAAATTVTDAATVLARAISASMGPAGVAVYTPSSEDPTRLQLRHSLGWNEADTSNYAETRIDDEVIHAEAARTNTPLWFADRPEWLGRYPTDARGASAIKDVHAVAALPIRSADQVLGVLTMSFRTPRVFGPTEQGFALTLVTQAGQAFERAALTDARWRIAQTLQHALLPPRLPTLSGMSLAARYLPAEGMQTGGDWYDIIALDPVPPGRTGQVRRVAFVVGDVVGHGAGAAAVMGQLRAALSSSLLQDQSPAQALTHLNTYATHVPGALASTVIVMVLDTATGRLQWARAGHLPPLLINPDDTTIYLEDDGGPCLGMTASLAFPEHHFTLPIGAGLLLYTDGLIERRGEPLDIGLKRLESALTGHAHHTPREVIDAVLDHTTDGHQPEDDIALILAIRSPEPLDGQMSADPGQLAVMRTAVGDWARTAGLDEDLGYDLQLALTEAISNSVEHAYPGQSGQITYRVQRRADNRVQVRVDDHGTWRPPPADPGHRGRGLMLIRALADDVTLTATDSGTHISFILPRVE